MPSQASKDPQAKKEPVITPVHKAKNKVSRPLWLAGHLVILGLGVYLLGVTLLLRKRWMLNRILYRVYFAVIASSYLASVHHYLEGESVRFSVLLAMDTVQYAAIAILWIFMPTHVTKTLPFTLISLLHVLDNFAPKLALKYEKPVSLAIGYTNILIFFKLVIDTIRIRSGAVVSLFLYGFFYRIRFQFSSLEQECFNTLFKAFDTRMSSKSTPEKIRGYWIRTKKRIQNYESVSVAEQRKKDEEAIRKANAELN